MALASLKELYLDELGDLYDAETQTIRMLPRLFERAQRAGTARHADAALSRNRACTWSVCS